MPLLTKILTFLLAFFLPIVPSMIVIGILITVDALTGYVKNKRISGDKFSSRKLKTTIVKMFLYQLLIITAHMLEIYMIPIVPLVKICLGTVALVEFTSLLENISIITGKNLLSLIKDKVMGYLNK